VRLLKIIAVGLLLLPSLVWAGAFDSLNASLIGTMATTGAKLQAKAIQVLSAFILVQMLITNLGLLKNGADLEAIWAKLLGSLLWFGFCFYVIDNGAEFITKVSQEFIQLAIGVSDTDGFNAPLIIQRGAVIAGNLVAKINDATSWYEAFLPAILGGLLGLVIIGVAAFIGFKVFLIQLETSIIIMIAPLSFAFLGLNAMKDQGIAPFKSLVSLIYRIIILAVIISGMSIMSNNLIQVIDSINKDSISNLWDVIMAGTAGYVLLGFLAFKSDSIAANLASGSTNMGTADVAAAAALGASTGALAGQMAGKMADGGKKPIQSMADFMSKNFGGNNSGIRNMSDIGTGGATSPMKPDIPLMSSGGSAKSNGSGGSGGGAPTMPKPSREANSSSGAAPSSSNSDATQQSTGGQQSNTDGSQQQAYGQTTNGASDSSSSDSGASQNPLSDSQPGSRSINPDVATQGGVGWHGGTVSPMTDPAAAREKETRDAARKDRQAAISQKRSGGSGESAGIAGGSPLEQRVGELVEAMSKPQKPGLRDRLRETNDHIARESASTGVSIRVEE
jgi:type IV secretion system protein TrbL